MVDRKAKKVKYIGADSVVYRTGKVYNVLGIEPCGKTHFVYRVQSELEESYVLSEKSVEVVEREED